MCAVYGGGVRELTLDAHAVIATTARSRRKTKDFARAPGGVAVATRAVTQGGHLMMKGLVASVLLLGTTGITGIAVAKPPLDFYREPRPMYERFDRQQFERPQYERPQYERPQYERPQYERQAFDRDRGAERWQRNDGNQRDAARPTPFSQLTSQQKQALCDQTGVCVRSYVSTDVEDKTK
jgi:hypothetical protein